MLDGRRKLRPGRKFGPWTAVWGRKSFPMLFFETGKAVKALKEGDLGQNR